MKKTLALVLALLMVLALVPTAFADTYELKLSPGEKYKVEVTVWIAKDDVDSVEIASVNGWEINSSDTHYKKTFSSEAAEPSVKVNVPYGMINRISSGTLWGGTQAHVKVTVSQLKGNWTPSKVSDLVVTNYDTDITSDLTITDDSVSFYPEITAESLVRSYSLNFSGKGVNSNIDYKENVKFTISYTNTTKPVYDLKFTSCDNAVLKDGVWFVDTSATSFDASNTPKSFTFGIAKNNGSKFTEEFYWAQDYNTDSYPAAIYDTADRKYESAGTTQITFNSPFFNGTQFNYYPKNNRTDTAMVTVETEYAIYRGSLKIKYRTDVWRVDPKGVSFAKDEYTIGVNEVLEPTYTTLVPVWHDVASIVKLSQTANTEKGIVDCDGNKITGLREGVAYVVLTYDDDFVTVDGVGTPVHYTDTVKVTVKGTYQVTDKANYIVTTSSSNLNVRSGAGTKYSKIGSLAKGTVVEVVEIKDGWAKIIFPSDKYTNGYVSAQYLTKQSTSPETVIGDKTVIARVLNVRSGAGTSYSIVGKLIRNTKVEVIETVANGSWSKIKFNGGYAYVSSTYIQ